MRGLHVKQSSPSRRTCPSTTQPFSPRQLTTKVTRGSDRPSVFLERRAYHTESTRFYTLVTHHHLIKKDTAFWPRPEMCVPSNRYHAQSPNTLPLVPSRRPSSVSWTTQLIFDGFILVGILTLWNEKMFGTFFVQIKVRKAWWSPERPGTETYLRGHRT